MTPHDFRDESDTPILAASVNRDLVRVLEWYSRWCMSLNHKKTDALVANKFRTVNRCLGGGQIQDC